MLRCSWPGHWAPPSPCTTRSPQRLELLLDGVLPGLVRLAHFGQRYPLLGRSRRLCEDAPLSPADRGPPDPRSVRRASADTRPATGRSSAGLPWCGDTLRIQPGLRHPGPDIEEESRGAESGDRAIRPTGRAVGLVCAAPSSCRHWVLRLRLRLLWQPLRTRSYGRLPPVWTPRNPS